MAVEPSPGTGSGTRAPGGLPATLSSFVGRETDVGQTVAGIRRSRLVTVTGAGGIGKTRLAREVAARSAGSFPDGVHEVGLAAVHAGSEIAATVINDLRLSSTGTGPAIDQLIGSLSDKQLLLLLDNCEHLLVECRQLVVDLLAGVPGLRVLTTSREPLGISGERVVALRPLAAPDPRQDIPLAEARAFSAVQLLEDRALAVRDRFALDDSNVGAAVQLVARLDGMPLAIELAAARLRSLSLDELTGRLDDRFSLLNRGDPTARTHHQTLRAMVEWSWDLCVPGERRLWAALSIFSGGADLDAIRALVDLPGHSDPDVLDALDGLVAKSVVQADVASGTSRYSMLETMIAFGREKLADLGELDRSATRHARYYLDLARAARDHFYTPSQLAWTRRLRGERANLAAAFDHLMSTEPRGALQLATALRFHWITGPLHEGQRWLDDALAVGGYDALERFEAVLTRTWIAAAQGDHQAGRRLIDEIERLAGEFDEPEWQARGRLFVGVIQQMLGQVEESDREIARAMAELTGAHNLEYQLVGSAVAMLGVFELGDQERGRSAYAQVVRLSEQCGETWVRSYAHAFLSFACWLAGEVDEAAELAARGLDIKIEFEDELGISMAFAVLGAVAFRRGDPDRAAVLFGVAEGINRALGARAAAYSGAVDVSLSQAIADTRAAIGDDAFRQAGVVAAGMTRRQAQDLANTTGGAASSARAGPAAVLTARELEVAWLVARGLSNRRIGEQLVVSPRTVDGHLERIFSRLGVRTRAEVAAWVAGLPREDGA